MILLKLTSYEIIKLEQSNIYSLGTWGFVVSSYLNFFGRR